MTEENTPNENEQQQQQQESGKNKIEERINQLYGQKKEAEEYSATLQTENQNLRTQMLELQETVNNLKEKVGDVQAPPTGNTRQEKTDGNAGNLDADGIRKVVEETVGNVLSQRDQNVQKADQLRQSHVKSWQQAVNEMPGLKDQNSDLYKTAQRIWERDAELQRSGAGPYKAAVMARGFIGSDNVSQEQLNSATQQNTAISNNLTQGNNKKQLEAVDKEIEDIKVQMASGKPITQTWPKYQALKQQRAELLGKTKKQ